MENIHQKVAKNLLEINAIKLNVDSPFTWASGWKSPIYCDNRLILSYPVIRSFIKEELVWLIKNEFGAVESIAGVATAGIPQGSLVAEHLGLPFLYVRSKPKGHGMENMIEGRIIKGQKVVVVEDLVSTGGSSIKATKALQENGIEVLGMVAIFSYGFDEAKRNFDEAKIKLLTLSNYKSLIKEALKLGYIGEEQVQRLKDWRKDPANWN